MKNQAYDVIESELNRRKYNLDKFVETRISYVLQRDDNNLSLRRVAQRLDLEFNQVKKLCGDKLKLLKGYEKRERGCNIIQVHDNFEVFRESAVFAVSFFAF